MKMQAHSTIKSRFASVKTRAVSNQKFCNVNVEFKENLTTEQVIQEISQFSFPQVILWYIGCRGVRINGIEFYRDCLIKPLLAKHPNIKFWLMDLTAWGAFKTPSCKVNNFSSSCNTIDSLDKFGIQCIKSSEIFKRMQSIDSEEVIKYFRKALAREFISKPSLHHSNINIRLGDIFCEQCHIICEYYNYDASKAYSILQYLEGCLVVEYIFLQQMANQKSDIEIVFALPNNELDYYKDDAQSFKMDVQFLIETICKENGVNNINLSIKFMGFKYGSCRNDRPYNAQGKVLKNSKLRYEDIIGIDQ